MSNTRIHPETGKTLRRDVRPQTVAFASMSCVVDVPGWYPHDDSDSIHTGAELAASDAAYLELRKTYGLRVRAVRKKLKLTQEEAGRIIGGGRRAFQKYERGATPPSDAAIGLIEILARHPEDLEILREVRTVSSEAVRPGAACKVASTKASARKRNTAA